MRRAAPRLTVAVVLGGAIGPLLLACGLGYVSGATASLLFNLELVFTTIVAAVVFHEHIGRRVATGTALVVVAGMVLAWSGSAELRWGALLIAGGLPLLGDRQQRHGAFDDLAPAHITLAKGVVAGGANLVIGLLVEGVPAATPASGRSWSGRSGTGCRSRCGSPAPATSARRGPSSSSPPRRSSAPWWRGRSSPSR